MQWLTAYATSSIGKKQLMAVSGLLLLLYVIAHLAGNLTIFGGRDAINSYAEGLRVYLPLLWAARVGLIVTVTVHIIAAASLFAENRRARGGRYRVFRTRTTPFYARSVALTGLFILFFVIYHLLHYTFGVVQPAGFHQVDPQGRHDVYAMVIYGFSSPLVSAVYVAAVAFLCMHLAHGIPSFFQTLGWRHVKYRRAIDLSGPILALIIFIGYASIPLAVMLEILKP